MQLFFMLIFAALAGVVMFVGFFALMGLWMALDERFRVRPLEEAVEKEFPIGEEAIFKGCYVSHWEIPAFTWDKDGDIWNRDNLQCQLIISYEGGWDWLVDTFDRDTFRGGFETFEIEFRGKIIEKGSFGHMGGCRYIIEVLEMLSARHRSKDSESLLRGSDAPKPPPEELLRPAKGSSPTDPETLLRPSEDED
jgi:hypothetical protein